MSIDIQRHIQKLNCFREIVGRACRSDTILSKDWYEKMLEIANLLLLSRKDTNFKWILRKLIENYFKKSEVSILQQRNLIEFVTDKNGKLKRLYNEREKLKKEYKNLERKLEPSSEVTDSHKQKLLKYKLMAQTCKLLTGTNFTYDSSDLSGYMYNEATDTLKAFSLDGEQEKEFLWSSMSKVYPVKLNIK